MSDKKQKWNDYADSKSKVSGPSVNRGSGMHDLGVKQDDMIIKPSKKGKIPQAGLKSHLKETKGKKLPKKTKRKK